jgi:U4/U6.U5 tri-snRNP-associated protein 3
MEDDNGPFAAPLPPDGEVADPPVTLDAELTPEEVQMMVAMGIPFGFDTTQGRHINDDGANAGAVNVKTTRQARQFMNRRGGFNRPLPAEKTGEKVPGD